MNMRIAIALVTLALASSCVSTAPTLYGENGGFATFALELKPDGTFKYCSWSDNGPTVWFVEGTWQWINRSRGLLETTTISSARREGIEDLNLPERAQWHVGTGQVTLQGGPTLRMRAWSQQVEWSGCGLPRD
jgi:hypothetical protein